METFTLQGIKLQNYPVVPFQKDVVKKVDLEVFTPKRVHYLVNALVNNTKLPSEQAMIRSEKRNQAKSGVDKADKAVGRPSRMPPGLHLRRRDFHLPNKYGRMPVARRNRGVRRGRGNGRLPPPIGFHPISYPSMQTTIVNGVPTIQPMSNPSNNILIDPNGLPILPANLPLGPNGLPVLPLYLPSPVGFSSLSPAQIPIVNKPQKIQAPQLIKVEKDNAQQIKKRELIMKKREEINKKREEIMKKMPEVVQKIKKVKEGKQRSNAFKTHDPEWIALKAYKAEACQLIQKYREEIKKDKEPIISEHLKDPVPLYFQKKKASQKRRRQQKHELIKKNRKALVQIFGNSIFQRGWPISRKQIKAALGILQQEPMDIENLSEFISMAEEKEIEPMSVENQSIVAKISKEQQP